MGAQQVEIWLTDKHERRFPVSKETWESVTSELGADDAEIGRLRLRSPSGTQETAALMTMRSQIPGDVLMTMRSQTPPDVLMTMRSQTPPDVLMTMRSQTPR